MLTFIFCTSTRMCFFFLRNFVLKYKIAGLSWKLVTGLVLVLESMVILTFIVLDFKIVWLSWDLIPGLEYIEVNLGLQFFCFWSEIPSMRKLGSKTQTVSWSWNLIPRLMLICQIHFFCSFFLLKITFLGKYFRKKRNHQFKLKFSP